MPKVVAIIQARMGSTRLPGKVLMDIGGKPALQWVIDAAKHAELIDQIVVVTPDQEIIGRCYPIRAILGPEDNVLKRFKIAVDILDPQIIVRLTADCPFIDPEIIDQCVISNSCAVDEWPDGMDIQVFNAAWLPLGDREHVVPINNNLPQLPCAEGNLRDIRLTLDTATDLERLRSIAKLLPRNRPPHWRETLAAYAKLEKIAA